MTKEERKREREKEREKENMRERLNKKEREHANCLANHYLRKRNIFIVLFEYQFYIYLLAFYIFRFLSHLIKS